ncbi:MAG: prepilin-type N-terminal cleavage/methylation domain-containing protein [Candidatus Nomurabacteria bacterium]|nr:MAG: prepilin-type N-terminal cleavage/methylation domain-containing protein [Candidatus Nomurabacteria bacterium]
MHRFSHNQEGQTLVEVIIAVSILLAGIVTSLTLGIVTVRAGQVSQNRTIADNLAREGLELVRTMRDTNWLQDNVWDQGLCASDDTTAIPDFLPDVNAWSLDFSVDDFADANAQVLYREDRENSLRPLDYYMQTAGPRPDGSTPSRFRRLLTISSDDGSCVDADVSYTVKSEVQWDEGGTTHSSIVEERLFDWRT